MGPPSALVRVAHRHTRDGACDATIRTGPQACSTSGFSPTPGQRELTAPLAVSAPDRVRQCVFQRSITANVGSRTDSAVIFMYIIFRKRMLAKRSLKITPNVYLMVVAGRERGTMVV